MAPEQISGQPVDGRTDQYSLACVAFQLLTGTVPFQRDSLPAVIYAHLSLPPPSLVALRPDLPAAVDQVVAKAMAKTAEKRYDSCGDFADALRDALGLTSYHRRNSASAPPHQPSATSSDPEAAGTVDSWPDSTPPGTVETPAAAVAAPRGTVETPASDLPTPTAAAMVIPDQDDETASPPPAAVSSLTGASEVPLPTVVESPPAAADPVPDELADGTEPVHERDQPTPAAQTDVRPRAAAETDVRPAAVPADADGDRDLERTGGLADPAAEPDRLTDHGPARGVAPPPGRPPARREPGNRLGPAPSSPGARPGLRDPGRGDNHSLHIVESVGLLWPVGIPWSAGRQYRICQSR